VAGCGVDDKCAYGGINKFVAVCVRVSVELSLVSSSYVVGRRGCKIISKEEGEHRLAPSSTSVESVWRQWLRVLKLLLTLKGLSQQLLGCWKWSRFRSSSLPRVYVDYYFHVSSKA